jgi:hypothetical protein
VGCRISADPVYRHALYLSPSVSRTPRTTLSLTSLKPLTSLTLSTVIACTWPECYPDGIYTEGLGSHEPYLLPLYVWVYCIVFWFLQDFAKVQCYYLLSSWNIFDINNTLRKGIVDEEEDYVDEVGLKQKLLV